MNDTLEARLKTLTGLQTLAMSPNSTIVPPEPNDTAGQRAIELLVPIRSLRDEIELKDTIGEGGMGIVHSGIQRSLGRSVAIKTLRPEHRRQQDVLTLLREAWVTGALEHPNILPIHDVKLDADGKPLVVLKRIDGTDWSDIMHDSAQMEDHFGDGDLLEQNLKVLMQVCHAIAFAHDRGIVHRDIKPENVMIGAFGEVYVLDWGIAVAIDDDGTGRFPLAANATEMAGTPHYMAPEMLGGEEGGLISPRTDVYLLGATLFEIAMGRPPHDGPSATALVTSVLTSPPALKDVPIELAGIVRRCMALEAQDRFGSADEVRVAISQFLDHRGSDKLATDAAARLEQLKQLVAGDEDDVRVAAHAMLGACRAGFSAALVMRSDNEHAQSGLRGAVELMVEYELRRGDARAAKDLLDELDERSELLEKRVLRGLDRQREAEERHVALEALGKDLDPETGTRTRMFVGMIIGSIWCVLPLLAGVIGDDSYRTQLGLNTAALVFCGALFLWARESLTKTMLNRRLVATVMIVLTAQFAMLFGCVFLGIDPAKATVLYAFGWGMAASLTALTLERKLWPGALGYAAAFVLSALWLEMRYYFMAGSNLLLTINFAIAWRPRNQVAPSSKLSSRL